LHLDVSAGIMQRGHMRFEPNINVEITRNGQTFKTPIVEIKNLNSFKALSGAVAYEYKRQVDQWLDDGLVMAARSKSTRGWDDIKQVTTLQREKEDADEYRYFPDPDLGIVEIDNKWKASLQQQMRELPVEKKNRYINKQGLNAADAQTRNKDPPLCHLKEQIGGLGADSKKTCSILLNYGARCANQRGWAISQLPASPRQIKQIVTLTSENK